MANHDAWTARLSEFVDGEMPDDERARCEAHVETCAECRRIADELIRVRDIAADLPERQPARDLWPGIAARIGVPDSRVLPLRRRWTFTLPQLAAAAVLLIMAGAAGTVMLTRTGRGAPAASPAVLTAAPATPAAFAMNVAYNDAVRELETVLARHRDALDTSTVRVLDESLATIDRAIARARAALATDPNDPYLNEHLAETMRRKLTVMRRAAALVSAS